MRTNPLEVRSKRAMKALEWIGGMVGAVPGAMLGYYVVVIPTQPYPDQAMMLCLVTVPVGIVIGAFLGQALVRRLVSLRS